MAYTKLNPTYLTPLNPTNLAIFDQGIYDATYPAYIDNAASPNNARIAMADTGMTFSRNVNDANTLAIFNKILGTGIIADFKAASVTKFSINANGNVISNGNIAMGGEITTIYGMRNTTSINNAKIYVPDTGAIISRNVADANSALTVNQVHASSTGKILDLQFGGVSKCRISTDGTVACNYLVLDSQIYSSAGWGYAHLVFGTSGIIANHDIADANTAFTINQNHASSTGKIIDCQFGGVSKASFSKDGNLTCGTINTYTLGSACASASTDFMAAGSGQFRACTDVKTAAYNIAAGDYWILLGGTNDYDVTLPTAVGRQGQVYIVQRVVGGTNVLRVATTSSQTINGAAAPLTLSTSIWTTKMFISDGANWKQAVSF